MLMKGNEILHGEQIKNCCEPICSSCPPFQNKAYFETYLIQNFQLWGKRERSKPYVSSTCPGGGF